ncbi:TBC1 domain family member 5 isoform X1 [Haematobia irritans]|uniref:TBC1 domain family member 5 isoform X1 n=1 Tax=Haematobia irritans TaxID=7368 RepID=UPI003F4FF584
MAGRGSITKDNIVGTSIRATMLLDNQTEGLHCKERYRYEWRNLLTLLDNKPEHIRQLALEGGLKNSKFRSIYWSLLLRVLNEDHVSWPEQRKLQRERYEILRQEFAKNPRQTDQHDQDNPLSQSSKSVWNQYFNDQELFGVIRQDVIRTFPGVDFFRKTTIQNIMSNILFYYARDHPYMCYRQGMHEILAPVLFVMYSDHQSLLHYKDISSASDIDKILLDVINPLYLEADAYFIFSRIMSCVESYYRVCSDNKVTGIGINGESPNKESKFVYTSEAEIIDQLNFIRDKILVKEDLHLHNYLLKLDIPLHIFGIRWLRLLFGREVALLDLLILWDAIFADSDKFDLPNYILVAMLIRIRDKLLLSDYTTCLTYLMRYPQNVDVSLILRHALHMKMPHKYDRPTNAFVYCTLSSTSQDQDRNGKYVIYPQVESFRSRSTSLGQNTIMIDKQITMLQTQNAIEEALRTRISSASEENRLAMEGYKANNSDLLRLELRNFQTVITVARAKLGIYLQTMRQHVPLHSPDEVFASLDGIEELCQFLDVKCVIPVQLLDCPIDQALEANEYQHKHEKKTESKEDSNADHALQSLPHLSYCTTQCEQHKTVYELPDNGFMAESLRILGNNKEIEMVPLLSVDKPKVSTGHTTVLSKKSWNGTGDLPSADPLRRKKCSWDNVIVKS